MRTLVGAIALVMAACHSGPDASWPGPDKSAKPIDIANLAPDGVAAAAGLRPLRLGAGESPIEVRIWKDGMGSPANLYRLVRIGGHVDGEEIFYWPAGQLPNTTPPQTIHDVMQSFLRGRCDHFELRSDFGVCRATFARRPDWESTLERMEDENLWTLPDESALPNVGSTLDGWGMMVELRYHDRYRAYQYNNPDVSLWPQARHAAKIARYLRTLVDSATKPAPTTAH